MAKVFEAPEAIKKSELLDTIDEALAKLVKKLPETTSGFLVSDDYYFACSPCLQHNGRKRTVYVGKRGKNGRFGMKEFCDFFGHIYHAKLDDVVLLDLVDCLMVIRIAQKTGVAKLGVPGLMGLE